MATSGRKKKDGREGDQTDLLAPRWSRKKKMGATVGVCRPAGGNARSSSSWLHSLLHLVTCQLRSLLFLHSQVTDRSSSKGRQRPETKAKEALLSLTLLINKPFFLSLSASFPYSALSSLLNCSARQPTSTAANVNAADEASAAEAAAEYGSVSSFLAILVAAAALDMGHWAGAPPCAAVLPVLLALQCGVVLLRCSAASPVGGDVSALIAFKRAVIEDPHSALADWNDADGNACDWHGVICSSPQGSVISLKLSNLSLKGFIAPELGQLSFLQELYLDHNLLFGTIPKQLGSLRNLRVLYLGVNRLAGPIPPELSGLSSVSILNFHSNGLTGNIPPELGKLHNLVELRLDRNRLRGSIPGSNATGFSPTSNTGSTPHNGLCPSPRLNVGDFSYNFLVGKIPPCLKYLPRSSFQGNCFQDEYSIRQRAFRICTSGSTADHIKGFKRPTSEQKHDGVQQPTWLIVLEIATGVLLLVFAITGAITASRSCKLKPSIRISSWNRSKSWSNEITVLIDSDMLKSLPKLSRQELEVACEDFSNIIGSTPETVVYKGTMKDGPEVSVISLCAFEGHWTSQHELFYQNKVIDLARLNHENTAKFLGYCRESDPFSRMLVFEYASNGTLYEHLHYGEGGQLSWLRRMKIAIGIAQGLRYLHTELQPPFAISELNSNSVYVTEDFTPKLVDFECWKMMFTKQHEKAHGQLSNKASFRGRIDSLDDDKHADIQGNTFAFGVILLEIISGRLPYCKDKGYLVDWAAKYLQEPEEIGKLVDPEVSGGVRAADLAVVCGVVSRCIDPDPSKRPSMQIIAGALENGIDLSAAGILKESSLAWAELALSL